jgi:hypothetical protein
VQAIRGSRPAASVHWSRYLRDSEPHRHWIRSSDCPAYLAQIRKQLYAPLVEIGVLEDFDYYDQWAELQIRGARELRGGLTLAQ